MEAVTCLQLAGDWLIEDAIVSTFVSLPRDGEKAQKYDMRQERQKNGDYDEE